MTKPLAPEVPEGWRAVWLPQHGAYLAFLDTDMPPGIEQPAVYGETKDETLHAIYRHKELAEVVRKWVWLHEGAV
ncbi:hypothetical protein FHX37_4610 [Haloactinospora alba]|uniref:Uncharacterized protein n=1 Tax=Haloactinospora alba TaxID=405555 RepID=A0A543N2L6_9ACTN|nr:hypothetical protein [Haloactinospora alba]TQN26073.1 hypothetical protein FHX37_4610 [Haloactinospora alba]